MAYDYDKTHARILESAAKRFMEDGFADASVRQICKDAGVTNGAFYAHFESKEDLFAKLVEPALGGLRELYGSETSRYMEIGSAKDVRAALDQTFSTDEAVIRYVYEQADAFRLLLTASSGTSYGHFKEQIVEAEKEGTTAFFELCAPYVAKPENMSDSLAAQTSLLVVSAIFDCLLSGASEEEAVRETQLVSEFCLAGLKQVWGI